MNVSESVAVSACLPDLLSALAKRMARVDASGSPSDTSAAAFHTQLRSLPTFGESFISGTTVTFISIISLDTSLHVPNIP
jgi:hypothetical protein